MPRWYKQLAAWNKKHGEAVQFLMFPCDEFNQELPSEEIVSPHSSSEGSNPPRLG
mgnify:CR=1 FL=1|tara:strand:- start:68 stop:232 length:165 start_codon:yes stop_codon:yes gene_type:complete